MRQFTLFAVLLLGVNIFANAQALTGDVLRKAASDLSIVFSKSNLTCLEGPAVNWTSEQLNNAITTGISGADIVEYAAPHKFNVINTTEDATVGTSFTRMEILLSNDDSAVVSLEAKLIKLVDSATAGAAKTEQVVMTVSCAR